MCGLAELKATRQCDKKKVHVSVVMLSYSHDEHLRRRPEVPSSVS